jgi:hypothetical protein
MEGDFGRRQVRKVQSRRREEEGDPDMRARNVSDRQTDAGARASWPRPEEAGRGEN